MLQNLNLSEADKIKLELSIDRIKSILHFPLTKQEITDAVITNNYDIDAAVNFLMDNQPKLLQEKKGDF